ncbi:hypothetical protein HQ39_01180 [Porphyromonas sp. COT-108 OH2963]|uniref:DUF4296 domain-containing protein n=1 Tax=Porphyromonas sp. COT-108 OH2963 TaxID=1515614 RepID=UPI00052C92AC|nr:DUF4296 domain-containing protein [Porphyromonas sp. COT-108 OH2963]KGN96693.1 hypothetical protein HQ39_01180 [Porphyromonas sp. COT-108 OH2963]
MKTLLRRRYNTIILSVFLCSILIFGCRTRPKYVLNSDEFYAVSKDIFIAEQILRSESVEDSVKVLYYQSIFDKHNLTQAQYDSSLVWYAKNVNLLNPIYDKIANELAAEEALLKVIKQDSLHVLDRLAPKIDDLWTHARQFEVPTSHSIFRRLFFFNSFPKGTDNEGLRFSFNVITPSNEERSDSLRVVWLIFSEKRKSVRIDTLYNHPSGQYRIDIPYDSTLFNNATRLIGLFHWDGVKSLQRKALRSFIDSIRFYHFKEENLTDTLNISEDKNGSLDTIPTADTSTDSIPKESEIKDSIPGSKEL